MMHACYPISHLLVALLGTVLLAGMIPPGIFAEDVHLDEEDERMRKHQDEEDATDVAAEHRLSRSHPSQHKFLTACVFPKFLQEIPIPSGETVDLLIGIRNSEEPGSGFWYRAEYAVAYLFNVDPPFHIQNFTGVAYNRTVHPDETATLNYRIRTDPRVEPRAYHLILQLFYMNERNETFLATPFNSTIHVLDSTEARWDLTSLWSTLFVLIAVVALGYWPVSRTIPWLYRKGLIGTTQRRGGGGSERKHTGPPPKKAGGDIVVDPQAELDWSYVPSDHRRFVKAPKKPKANKP